MVFLIGFGLLVGLFFQSFVWKVTSTYSTERFIDQIHRSMETPLKLILHILYFQKHSLFWAIKLPGIPKFGTITIYLYPIII